MQKYPGTKKSIYLLSGKKPVELELIFDFEIGF